MSTPSVGAKNSSSPSTSSSERGNQAMITYFAQSPFKDLVKGVFSGWTEVAIDQPLVNLTKIVQRRMNETNASGSLRKTLSARQLYGGALVNGTGMSLVTSVQMFTIGGTKRLLSQDSNSLPLWKKVVASSTGAMAAAPFACFSEMLMDRYRDSIKRYEEQGKKGMRPTYLTVTRDLWKSYGTGMITKGLGHTMGRDVPFVIAYDSMAPYVKEMLIRNSFFRREVEKQHIIPFDLVATIGGSVFAGVIGLTITHPLDTRKTRIQAGLSPVLWPRGFTPIVAESLQLIRKDRRSQTVSVNRRVYEATVYLFKNLLAEPYKGFSWRFTRGVSAVTILNVVSWLFERCLSQYK